MKAPWDETWSALYPDRAWPGVADAFEAMAQEIRSLRLLTDNVVSSALEEENRHRSTDEIQRAHDIVGQFCVETHDLASFEHVSALCWVLRHDHNTAFGQILEMVEDRLARAGITIVRLPKLFAPEKEN